MLHRFYTYADALERLGVPGDVINFIIGCYGEGNHAMAMLHDTAWYYLGLRGFDQVAEALAEWED